MSVNKIKKEAVYYAKLINFDKNMSSDSYANDSNTDENIYDELENIDSSYAEPTLNDLNQKFYNNININDCYDEVDNTRENIVDEADADDYNNDNDAKVYNLNAKSNNNNYNIKNNNSNNIKKEKLNANLNNPHLKNNNTNANLNQNSNNNNKTNEQLLFKLIKTNPNNNCNSTKNTISNNNINTNKNSKSSWLHNSSNSTTPLSSSSSTTSSNSEELISNDLSTYPRNNNINTNNINNYKNNKTQLQSSTLLVKKTSNSNLIKKNNEVDDIKNYLQYSLITTQISKKNSTANINNNNNNNNNNINNNNESKISSNSFKLNNNSRSSDLLVLKPSNRSNNNFNYNNQIISHHDTTLLTPLQNKTNNSNKNKSNKNITIENISSPTLVSFDSYNYFNKLNKSIISSSSAQNQTSPLNNNESNSTNTNTNVKSASTSYLLSKITSLASLTMPKNRPLANNVSSLSTTSSSSNASSTQQSPIMTNASGNSLMTNIANKTTKFFNRKLSQQQIEISTTPLSSNSYLLLSSSSANSIEQDQSSPLSNKFDESESKELNSSSMKTSPLYISEHLMNYKPKCTNNIKNLKSSSSCSSSTTSSISSSANNNNSNSNSNPNKVISSSRRAFKKRSQSIHGSVEKMIWFYNESEDCWFTTQFSISGLSQTDSNFDNQMTLTKSSINAFNKRKPLISSSSSCSSSNSLLSDLISNDQVIIKKIRLNQILIKYLTLIELKYLKQICFNKLQKQLELIQHEPKNMNVINQSTKLQCIPKDDSMKTIKTKNISSTATRSRSVDFKFFEEIKENYFFKKSQKDSNELVFGQSLYKCILNDLKQSNLSRNLKNNLNTNSNQLGNQTVNKKWNKSSNLLIASKFDLNILNGLNNNIETKNTINNQTDSTCSNTKNTESDLFFSKRNSVLFEALDLKNVNFNKKQSLQLEQPTKFKDLLIHKKHSISSASATEASSHPFPKPLNNQNLSIRSEGLVPNIVKSCCKHISEHGLDVVGIFRIDSSKKRIKELKEMYDSGKEVRFDESFNSNDTACLLKEYLRSLPEPLLTRDLYSSFLATNRINDPTKRLEVIRYLICLLPVPNRDTLEVLLKLLDKVRSYSEPVIDEKSKTVSGGNKMDAFNLAMVFGPNLLKKHKLSQISLNTKSNDLVNDKYNLIDDIDSVISVTKYLIENQNSIFSIDSNLHNELIKTINNISPAEVNSILNRKTISSIGISILQSNSINAQDLNSDICSLNSNLNNLKLKTCDESSSSTSSTNELDRIINRPGSNNQIENVDFIDNGTGKIRQLKTKLHKIANNLTYTNETINFINSPSHSPVRAVIKPPKHRVSEPYKISENINTLQVNKTGQNSSLLLMIQSQGNKSKTKQSISNENNENRVMSKSVRSLSNLNVLNDYNTSSNRNQQSDSIGVGPGQYAISVNSNRTCAKYFDNSKFNTIGEQETLV